MAAGVTAVYRSKTVALYAKGAMTTAGECGSSTSGVTLPPGAQAHLEGWAMIGMPGGGGGNSSSSSLKLTGSFTMMCVAEAGVDAAGGVRVFKVALTSNYVFGGGAASVNVTAKGNVTTYVATGQMAVEANLRGAGAINGRVTLSCIILLNHTD